MAKAKEKEAKLDRRVVQEMFHAAKRALSLQDQVVSLFPYQLIKCGCVDVLTAQQKDRFDVAAKEGQGETIVFSFPAADVMEALQPLMNKICPAPKQEAAKK